MFRLIYLAGDVSYSLLENTQYFMDSVKSILQRTFYRLSFRSRILKLYNQNEAMFRNIVVLT